MCKTSAKKAACKSRLTVWRTATRKKKSWRKSSAGASQDEKPRIRMFNDGRASGYSASETQAFRAAHIGDTITFVDGGALLWNWPHFVIIESTRWPIIHGWLWYN